MLPKKGIVLHGGGSSNFYAAAIAYALREQLGTTHQAVKVVMRWTGAGERTVKNWLSGVSGPSGQHLIELIRHSDNVLEVLLSAAGRPGSIATQKLVGLRDRLADAVEEIDELLEKK